MFKEFRDFIARGNVLDLAVGIIIGAAFTGVVNSLVNDIINPIIGLILGGVDFSNLFFAISTETFPTPQAAEAAGVATFRYGAFITAIINFFIIAWAVFLLVKAVNKAQALSKLTKAEEKAVALTEVDLLTQIRDALTARSGEAEAVPPLSAPPAMQRP